MSSMLSTLKRLATCLGCCKSTKDNPAESNAEAIDFICENYKPSGGGVTSIELDVEKNGKVKSGAWTDSAGKHEITINH